MKNKIKLETLLSAAKNIADANSSIVARGDGKSALNLSINAYGNLLTFANDFYDSEKYFSDRRLVHVLHILLQRRLMEIVTFAIKSSGFKSPTKRDFLSLRLINNIGATDKSRVVIERLAELSENQLNGKSDQSAALPEGFPPGDLPQALNLLDTSKLEGFKSIIGIDNQVGLIQTKIQNTVDSRASVCLILHGPPGTGKTSLAMAVGAEYGLPVVSISASGLGGMYVGEKESNLNRIFEYIKDIKSNLVLFVDEADSFMRTERPNDKIGTQMVRKIIKDYVFDMVTKKSGSSEDVANNTKTVILILATNYISKIMSSIKDLSVEIMIPLPDVESMKKVIEYYRRVYKLNLLLTEIDDIAAMSSLRQFSPSHVNLLFRRLASNLIYRLLTHRVASVNVTDLSSALVQPVYTLGNEIYESETSSARMITFNGAQLKGGGIVTVAYHNTVTDFRKNDLMPLINEAIDYDSVKPKI